MPARGPPRRRPRHGGPVRPVPRPRRRSRTQVRCAPGTRATCRRGSGSAWCSPSSSRRIPTCCSSTSPPADSMPPRASSWAPRSSRPPHPGPLSWWRPTTATSPIASRRAPCRWTPARAPGGGGAVVIAASAGAWRGSACRPRRSSSRASSPWRGSDGRWSPRRAVRRAGRGPLRRAGDRPRPGRRDRAHARPRDVHGYDGRPARGAGGGRRGDPHRGHGCRRHRGRLHPADPRRPRVRTAVRLPAGHAHDRDVVGAVGRVRAVDAVPDLRLRLGRRRRGRAAAREEAGWRS